MQGVLLLNIFFIIALDILSLQATYIAFSVDHLTGYILTYTLDTLLECCLFTSC